MNFTTEGELHTSPLCQDPTYRARFPVAYRFIDPTYENAVSAFLTRPVSAQAFRARLSRHAALATAESRRLMRFRVQRLWPR